MEDIITCPVCLELFDLKERLPLVLSCGHTLCRKCVTGISAGTDHIQCPQDRSIDARSLNALNRNFLICQVVEHHQHSPGQAQCQLHNKSLKLYCRSPCAQTLCSKCLLESHQSHQVVDYRDVLFVAQVQGWMQEHVDLATREEEQLTAELTCMENLISANEKRKAAAKQQVRKEFVYLTSAITHKAEEVLQELENEARTYADPIMAAGYQLKLQYDQSVEFKRQLMGLLEALPRVTPENRLSLLVQLDSLIASKPDLTHDPVEISDPPPFSLWRPINLTSLAWQIEELGLDPTGHGCSRKRRRLAGKD